jgi:methylmalonyl-CoA epimerase
MLAGKGIDHIAIAVNDLDAALTKWELLGAELMNRQIVKADLVDEAMLSLGSVFIQLVSPISPESPVSRFLARRGEGLHHIGIRVTKCTEAVGEMTSLGFAVIDQEPREGSQGTRVAFIHPKSANGTLIELVERPG